MSKGIKSKETLVRLTWPVLAAVLALMITPDAIGQLVGTKDLISGPVKPSIPTQPTSGTGEGQDTGLFSRALRRCSST